MENKKTGVIYKITSPTGQIYIGKTVNIKDTKTAVGFIWKYKKNYSLNERI